ncbi:MAG: type II toxin-antitoxin system HigB family toxin [Candidatus Marinimicrobia bacterium]|jgi:mRNA interferase HigB|nr:type II toxin-antitoxin system HigB family toxin [Candidatus Neomarinimicrobiota bacterium]MBT3675261.1 type II toxin-antitoxin system HigB family toxin [Candidatus Neomarinimicrobiota bacterium]MBT3763336.1 type II toxin-antitoxin system HigB family toxin [Candidatus Neomarinimicrobiota bacterium]MBT4067678.1 type II toxin-antitoxin system HigB family toxin [Candidatus Neomarinimicrobiota bacterium]MBT4269877.1 type II toxin-antitoxin system HigB family toxin [Candidatus Neomarinimicrobiota
MRIIAIKTLKEFWKEYHDAEDSLRAWYSEVKAAKWKTPNDIKEKYRSVSIMANNRAVFNIAGNKYRLIVAIKYEFQIVYIRFIGTHKQYDKINAKEI